MHFKFRLFLLPFVFVFLLLIVYSNYPEKAQKTTPMNVEVESEEILIENSTESIEIENIMDIDADLRKNEEPKIFFIETHLNPKRPLLNPRQACSVESAARTNPQSQVYLIFATNSKKFTLKHTNLIKILSTYPNIHFLYLVPLQFTHNSMLRRFFESKIMEQSNFPVENRADVMRVELMSRYGGQYLDLDIICLVPMNKIKYKNFGCLQDKFKVNNAVMHFKGDSGKKILTEYKRHIMRNFNPYLWAVNGPRMYTRAITTFCNRRFFKEHAITKCGNFTVLPATKCHPIPHEEFFKFYEEEYKDEVMSRIKKSGALFVHIWNKMQLFGNRRYKLDVNSENAYVELAKKHCPKVFGSVEDYF